MTRLLLGVVFTIMALIQSSLAQTTRYVGNCKVSKGYFTTIMDAVNAAGSGDTIDVCPGNYLEQVKISTPQVTLQGVSSHNSSRAFVEPISPQSVASTVLGTQLAPMVWVTAPGVTVKNIFALAAAACQNTIGATPVGFFYASGSSGTLNHVATSGCGDGIWVENASTDILGITIENSLVTGFQVYGIVAASKQPANTIPVLSATIRGNRIQEAIYGIYLDAVGGITSGNIINAEGRDNQSTATYGIWDAAPASVTGNTILADSNIASGIKINLTNASVTNNFVTSTGNIGIDFSCLAVTNVTGNTLTAIYGISNVPGTFTGANIFFNTYQNRSGGC